MWQSIQKQPVVSSSGRENAPDSPREGSDRLIENVGRA